MPRTSLAEARSCVKRGEAFVPAWTLSLRAEAGTVSSARSAADKISLALVFIVSTFLVGCDFGSRGSDACRTGIRPA
jgi:hypothetical protein